MPPRALIALGGLQKPRASTALSLAVETWAFCPFLFSSEASLAKHREVA